MSEHDFRMQGTSRKGVLLVHGLTGSPAEMRFVAKPLNRAGFSIYAPTIAGHCQDEKALLATTYEDWVESIRLAIREFSKEVDELYVAGICVGGAIGLMAAHLEGEHVKGSVIYSALLDHDGWNTPWYYKLQFLIPLVSQLPFAKYIRYAEAPPYGIKSDRVRKAVMGNGGDSIAGTLAHFPLLGVYQNQRLNRALKRMLPDIHIPTLLIHAKEDDVGHPRNAEKIQKLHGGHCEIILLDNSYHLIHVDQERHKVAALTAEFFGVPQAQPEPEIAAA